MELTYVPASQSDIETIFAMSAALIDDYEILENINYEKVIAWVRWKIESGISEYRCVFCDGQKAGYYRFSAAEGMMEIDDLYILPDFRNRGIGTAVIRKCCEETTLPIMLYVFTRNTGALELYQRLGFQITREVGESRRIMVRPPSQEAL